MTVNDKQLRILVKSSECLNILVRGSLRKKISSNEPLHPKCGVGEIIAKYSNQFTLISVECNPRPGGN